MQEINAWLTNGQDYQEGVGLYLKYGSNTFLQSLFKNGPTPYNTQKLVSELKSLAPPPATEQAPITKEPTPKQPTNETTNQPNNQPTWLPDAQYRYLKIKEEIKTKYKQLERNMWLLGQEKRETVLHLTAKQILTINDAIQDRYALIDYYDEHGFFPDKRKKEPTTDEKQRLMVSISKAKARLKKPNCRDKEATQSLLIDLQKKLDQLRRKDEA